MDFYKPYSESSLDYLPWVSIKGTLLSAYLHQDPIIIRDFVHEDLWFKMKYVGKIKYVGVVEIHAVLSALVLYSISCVQQTISYGLNHYESIYKAYQTCPGDWKSNMFPKGSSPYIRCISPQETWLWQCEIHRDFFCYLAVEWVPWPLGQGVNHSNWFLGKILLSI